MSKFTRGKYKSEFHDIYKCASGVSWSQLDIYGLLRKFILGRFANIYQGSLQPPCVDIKPGIDPTFQINMLATGALSSSVYLDIFTIYTSCILSGKHFIVFR